MTDRLARVMHPSYIPVWLNRPLEALDDDKPVEVLARGGYRRVAQLIAELDTPASRSSVALDVEATLVAGEWLRHAPHRSSLLGRAAEPTDGRWQHGAVVRGLYLADNAATAIAEWYRFLAERGLPPAHAIPHDQHVWRISLELADLSTPARLAAVGLPPPQPSRRSWSAFQGVGDALWRAGWPGLLAPSAARPRSLVICVFAHGTWPPSGCEPVRTVEISDVPAPPTGMTT